MRSLCMARKPHPRVAGNSLPLWSSVQRGSMSYLRGSVRRPRRVADMASSRFLATDTLMTRLSPNAWGSWPKMAGHEIASHLATSSGWRERTGIAGVEGCGERLNPPNRNSKSSGQIDDLIWPELWKMRSAYTSSGIGSEWNRESWKICGECSEVRCPWTSIRTTQ